MAWLNQKSKRSIVSWLIMNIRQAFVVTAIPCLIGTFGLTAPSYAAHPFHQVAQAVESPNRPPDSMRRTPRINFAAAAVKLGVTEAKLKNAMGLPAQPPSQSEQMKRPPRPNFKAAAAKLGVTEQQLVQALGLPPHPPSPDGASAQKNRPVPPSND